MCATASAFSTLPQNDWSQKTPGSLPGGCASCAARHDGMCAGLTPHLVDVFASYKAGDCVFKAGEDLFSQGAACDSIYNLVDGWVILYSLTEDGRRQILDFCLPGSMLGSFPANGGPATYGAQALTDVTVCVVPGANVEALVEDHPRIALQMAWQAARDRGLAYDHLASIGRHSARERVARLLLELFVRCRVRWPGHDVSNMHLPLTQEHIGDATGLTGVHVNRVLRSLREEGIVNFHYGRLRVIDPDKLVETAGVDMELIRLWTQQSYVGTPAGRPTVKTTHGASPIPSMHDEDDDCCAFFLRLMQPQAGQVTAGAARGW